VTLKTHGKSLRIYFVFLYIERIKSHIHKQSISPNVARTIGYGVVVLIKTIKVVVTAVKTITSIMSLKNCSTKLRMNFNIVSGV